MKINNFVHIILISVFGFSACHKTAVTGNNTVPNPPHPHPNLPVTPVEPAGSSRFAVLNACSQDIWLENQATADGTPFPAGNVFIPAGTQHDYPTLPTMTSFRAWAKFQCDSSGNNCIIGQELNPCPAGGCQPAIDTGIEFTLNPSLIDYDISLVNGFTNPISITLFNSSGEPTCQEVDASALSVANNCPTSEDLSTPLAGWVTPGAPTGPTAFGGFNSYIDYTGRSISLLSADLYVKSPVTSETIGCFAPYFKLLQNPRWNGIGVGFCPGAGCKPQAFGSPVNLANPAYDDRVLMYANPFTGCDLAPKNNCQVEKGTPLPASDFINANAWKTLSAANGFGGFCSTPAGETSKYCSDATAGQTPGRTAPNFMGNTGPVARSAYVQNLHSTIPKVYAWQYDDLGANFTCNSADTKIVYTIYCMQ